MSEKVKVQTDGVYRGGLSYTGETYESKRKASRFATSERMPEVQWVVIKRTTGHWEGSLANLHMKQNIGFPYAEYCLGASSDPYAGKNMSHEETAQVMAQLLEKHDLTYLAKHFECSKAALSNWSSGRFRGPAWLKELL